MIPSVCMGKQFGSGGRHKVTKVDLAN